MDERFFYHALASSCGGSFEKLLKIKGGSKSWKSAWEAFEKTSARVLPEDAEEDLAKHEVRLILQSDEEYPELLKEIPHSPFGIYVKGVLYKNIPILGIVGTRKATEDGIRLAREFAEKISKEGVIIVSGLALGIDSASHRGAICAKGKTYGVFGNGLHLAYPRTNQRLAREILDTGGALISEYPPGTPPLPHQFLERNRLISGLSHGVLIIESPARSGALATARFALEQNREVFVLPGPVRHPHYKGSHRLIQEGATLATSPEEILSALGVKKNIKTDLSQNEAIIELVLRNAASPLQVDKIVELTNLEAKTVQEVISFFIIEGIAEETGRGYRITL